MHRAVGIDGRSQRALGELSRREAAPLDTIPVYVKRDTNEMPEEVATKAPNGSVEKYARRANTNTIPAEVATMSPNGPLTSEMHLWPCQV